MRVSVRINVEKSKNSLMDFMTTIELENESTYLDLKNKIKSTLNLSFDIEKDSILLRNKEVKDADMVSDKNQLLYKLIVN